MASPFRASLLLAALLVLAVDIRVVECFPISPSLSTRTTRFAQSRANAKRRNDGDDVSNRIQFDASASILDDSESNGISRRLAMDKSFLFSAAAALSVTTRPPLAFAVGEADDPPPKIVENGDIDGGNVGGKGKQEAAAKSDDKFVMYKTASGLKYIELVPSTTSTQKPKYGQLCIINYKAYLKLPAGQKEKKKFDQADSYITKHGNGRLIPGLDEGLHTMTVGSTRRLIIPPKLGFIDSGLGPLPSGPFDRRALNNLLEQMIDQKGGNLVYDVTLTRILDDEADQGYYEDGSMSEQEMAMLQKMLKNTVKST